MTSTNETTAANLLTEPLIQVTTRDGTLRALTLPGVLEALSGGEAVDGFPGLQPHQWPAWHAFLTQVAALASLDAGPGADEEEWRARLRGLTASYSADEPWCLVVEDLAQPAFMQPPVPEGSLRSFDGPYDAPDASALDLLVTATNHDVKMERQANAGADHWLFDLIAFQTFSGYSGKGNYGVIRMNAGYATRPLVGLTPSREWSAQFRRDLSVLLDAHDRLASEAKLPVRGGWSLLWLPQWDGQQSIPFSDCDPYVIEIARRVRLIREEGRVRAYRRSTSAPRLSPKSDVLKGNVGDPWIPVDASGNAANVGANGWDYSRLRQVLLGDGYAWSPCQQPRPEDPEEVWFYAVGLARGQGKTDGFHERWVFIPKEARFRLFDTEARRNLSETAKERVDQAGEVRRVLHQALIVLLASAPEQRPNFRDDSDRRWLNQFERAVDAVFFKQLWADAPLEHRQRQIQWARTLREIVEECVWPRAEAEAPVADARRERAQAAAWRVLRGGLRKALTDAYEEEHHAAS